LKPKTATYQIIRVQESSWLDDLCRLRDGLMAHHGPASPSDLFRQFTAGRLADDTMLMLLALADDEPVGYGMAFDVAEHPFMPERTRAGYISQFFVAADHRRAGVGGMLMTGIDDWFAARGVSKVMLNVAPDNPVGQQFWQKHGFEPLAIRLKRVRPA
jgi:GNAT superfamily N-acetyltransferase